MKIQELLEIICETERLVALAHKEPGQEDLTSAEMKAMAAEAFAQLTAEEPDKAAELIAVIEQIASEIERRGYDAGRAAGAAS